MDIRITKTEVVWRGDSQPGVASLRNERDDWGLVEILVGMADSKSLKSAEGLKSGERVSDLEGSEEEGGYLSSRSICG